MADASTRPEGIAGLELAGPFPVGAYAAKLPEASVHLWYEREAPQDAATGLADLTDVPVRPGTRAYLCGPLPFMRAVRAQLIGKGVAPADIHYEVFGPDLWLARES